ncbi:MAG: hypothetical protein Q9192_008211 [Flavoplaca navasiana]
MWEVDPETKSKLLALQKLPGNTTCCDCSAPSPQWASPKFGTFICLTCAGLHRGLGVHISFVRSITMDAFKGNEILRMEKGGNGRWKAFWEERMGKSWGRGCGEGIGGMEERYGGTVGEEWKERLGCEVEGREFKRLAERKETEKKEVGGGGMGLESMGMGGKTQKEMNEDFFARKGNENENRRADLPPSQGGKYAGFGSQPTGGQGEKGGNGEGMPGVDDFQKDPVAALTKGLGWFTTTVGKSAKSVNDGWIQPNVQKLAESDLSHQARLTAAHVASNIQAGSKNAAEQFNRFVEDSGSPHPSSHPTNSNAKSKTAPEPKYKDFWDSFGEPVEEGGKSVGGGAGRGGMSGMGMGTGGGMGGNAGGRESPIIRGRASPAPIGKSNAVGTAAMRKGVKEKEEDKWDDF